MRIASSHVRTRTEKKPIVRGDRMGPTESDDCLAGILEDWPLPDLLQWLHRSTRTGMLRVGRGLDAGVLFFREGELYRCELARLSGEEALAELMGRHAGEFCLIQRQVPEPRRNIQRSTRELLAQ